MTRGGQARWNDETQRWEDGTPPPAPYTGPMPPRPSFAPSAAGGGAPAGAAPPLATGPSAADPLAAEPRPADPPATDPLASRAPAAEPFFPRTPPADWFVAPEPAFGPEYVTEPAVRHRSVGLMAGAAVAVIAAAVGGGYLLWGHGGDDPPAARPAARTKASASDDTATASPTGESSGGTAATRTATPLSTALPDGYRLVHDKKGFTLAVPRTWERSERRTGVFYTAPDDRRLLQIFEIKEPDTTPYEALETASRGLSGNPGYKEISLEPLGYPGPGTDATQLVYAYDSERLDERVKVVDCAFTVADGRQFAVLVLGPEANWPEQEWTQQNMLQSFVPHG
ncbi:hypothetical protein OHT20_14855 [Streptomyces caniferus]|uniref:Serine/arginine repetitive matrix protein 2 n=1 Tax=Streptomyces caniferus TaxID=285557 RepID=A0A640S1X9_9ACTN|nr:hypothetical protein [Streptomyces caniferus]GFE05108.1 hypothetical protein Scani_13760 [Streptomyces caniferus]